MLIAERKDRHYRLFHTFVTMGPTTGGILAWTPDTPPSMNRKTVVVQTNIGSSLMADSAILRMELD